MAVLAWATMHASTPVQAEPATSEAAAEAVPLKTNSHLKLCAQLGLRVGQSYEFLISSNEDVHYWTIRSLGGKGWILVKDSRYPATWVNLSQVIAVTPLGLNPAVEREKKPNRAR